MMAYSQSLSEKIMLKCIRDIWFLCHFVTDLPHCWLDTYIHIPTWKTKIGLSWVTFWYPTLWAISPWYPDSSTLDTWCEIENDMQWDDFFISDFVKKEGSPTDSAVMHYLWLCIRLHYNKFLTIQQGMRLPRGVILLENLLDYVYAKTSILPYFGVGNDHQQYRFPMGTLIWKVSQILWLY